MKTCGLRHDTLAPVSHTALRGKPQMDTDTKMLLSSTTEFIHAVCLRLSVFPAQLPRWYAGDFSLNLGDAHDIRA